MRDNPVRTQPIPLIGSMTMNQHCFSRSCVRRNNFVRCGGCERALSACQHPRRCNGLCTPYTSFCTFPSSTHEWFRHKTTCTTKSRLHFPMLPSMALPSVHPCAAPDPAWAMGKESQRKAQFRAATVLGHIRVSSTSSGWTSVVK